MNAHIIYKKIEGIFIGRRKDQVIERVDNIIPDEYVLYVADNRLWVSNSMHPDGGYFSDFAKTGDVVEQGSMEWTL